MILIDLFVRKYRLLWGVTLVCCFFLNYSVHGERTAESPGIAYVRVNGNDNKARLGDERSPFSTIDAALIALSPKGGILYIGPGSFNSPDRKNMKSNIALIGSGKPTPDWTIASTSEEGDLCFAGPRKLQGGTILQGTLNCSLLDNITIRDLGIDVGAIWCWNFNKGDAAEGLLFAQKYDPEGGLSAADGIHEKAVLSPPRFGISVNNVSVLCRDSDALVHAMLFENLYAPQIAQVSTYFGVHGVVLKTIGGALTQMDAHGHRLNGLIIKANDYAFSRAVQVSNIYITSIEHYDGGGIVLLGENQLLQGINISNFSLEKTSFGVKNAGSIKNVSLANGTVYSVKEKGIVLDGQLDGFLLSNITVDESGGDGISVTISKGFVAIQGAKVSSNNGDGISIKVNSASKVSVVNVHSQGNKLKDYVIEESVSGYPER